MLKVKGDAEYAERKGMACSIGRWGMQQGNVKHTALRGRACISKRQGMQQ